MTDLEFVTPKSIPTDSGGDECQTCGETPVEWVDGECSQCGCSPPTSAGQEWSLDSCPKCGGHLDEAGPASVKERGCTKWCNSCLLWYSPGRPGEALHTGSDQGWIRIDGEQQAEPESEHPEYGESYECPSCGSTSFSMTYTYTARAYGSGKGSDFRLSHDGEGRLELCSCYEDEDDEDEPSLEDRVVDHDTDSLACDSCGERVSRADWVWTC